jgi:hypothetical protein
MRSIEYHHLLILLLSVINLYTTNGQNCPLCGNSPGIVPEHLDHFVEPDLICSKVWIDSGINFVVNSPGCDEVRAKYGTICCNKEKPVVIYPSPAPPPGDSGTGTEPPCRICNKNGSDKNGFYPGKPNEFIVARYVGEFNCHTLYDRGNSGLIPGFMCGPLQDYAWIVCGCEYGVATPPGVTDKITPANPAPVDPVPAPVDPVVTTPAPISAPRDPPVLDVTPTPIGARKNPGPDLGKQAMKLTGDRNGPRLLRGGNEKQSNPMESEEPLEV